MKSMKAILRFLPFIIAVVFYLPGMVLGDVITVRIKGVDDGERTTKQQDYKEAVLNAKVQAIERAGIHIKSQTKVENYLVKEDIIETKAEGVLLPGFEVLDVGYLADGTYQIVLIGEIKIVQQEEVKIEGLTYSPSSEGSLFRVKMYEFPYSSSATWLMHSQLGDIGAYMLRIYPKSAFKIVHDAIDMAEEIGWKLEDVSWKPNDKYGFVLSETPKKLLKSPFINKIKELLKNGGVIQVAIDPKIPYLDIPVPPGKYFIEYSLLFFRAKLQKYRNTHPNYPNPSAKNRWGPPKVIVKSEKIANIEFRPTNSVNFYKYANHPKKGNWEGYPVFKDWIKYLMWSGDWE